MDFIQIILIEYSPWTFLSRRLWIPFSFCSANLLLLFFPTLNSIKQLADRLIYIGGNNFKSYFHQDKRLQSSRPSLVDLTYGLILLTLSRHFVHKHLVKNHGDTEAQCWQLTADCTKITSNQANRKGEVQAPICCLWNSHFQLKPQSWIPEYPSLDKGQQHVHKLSKGRWWVKVKRRLE